MDLDAKEFEITIYKDTIPGYKLKEDEENLIGIMVPNRVLNRFVTEKTGYNSLEDFLWEYTADDTDGLYSWLVDVMGYEPEIVEL